MYPTCCPSKMYHRCYPAGVDKNFSDTDKGDEPAWDDS